MKNIFMRFLFGMCGCGQELVPWRDGTRVCPQCDLVPPRKITTIRNQDKKK